MNEIKRFYAAPAAEIISVDTVDVILTSGPEQPAPEPPDETPEAPEEQPEQPAPKLNFFQKIIKAVTDFFANIGNWFKNLFAKK